MELPSIAGWLLLGILGIASIPTQPTLSLLCLIVFLSAGAAGSYLFGRGNSPFTDGPIFFACRWARNNFIFPTQVSIQPTQVIRHKERIIGAEEESISITQIASVKIATGFFWSNLIIESTGGANPIICHGHLNRDATTLKALIQQYQPEYFEQRTPRLPATDPRVPDAVTVLTLTLIAPVHGDGERFQAIATHRYELPHASDSPPLPALILDLLTHGPAGSYLRITHAPSVNAP
jgi:hypothetical protein